jgi:hypothetical protein
MWDKDKENCLTLETRNKHKENYANLETHRINIRKTIYLFEACGMHMRKSVWF